MIRICRVTRKPYLYFNPRTRVGCDDRILEEAAQLEELSAGAMLQLAENESQMEDAENEQNEEDEAEED